MNAQDASARPVMGGINRVLAFGLAVGLLVSGCGERSGVE